MRGSAPITQEFEMDVSALPLIRSSDLLGAVNANDRVYTPDKIAKNIVRLFKPTGKCLDPCRGKGAFWRHLPEGSDWCEIEDGKNFFAYKQRVDWIVSNPPYSNWHAWLRQSFGLAENVVYLVPVAKVWKSWETMMLIKNYGGVVHVDFLPSRKCGFPFGFPCGAFHFRRGHDGPMKVTYGECT